MPISLFLLPWFTFLIIMELTKLQKEAFDVLELIESVVEEHCDTNCISGEKVWTFIYALAEEKLEEFPIDLED